MRAQGLCTLVYCHVGTWGTALLSWTITSLRAGASGGGLERRGLLGQLLKIGQVRRHLGELLLVLMLLLPLLLDQLLEIGQTSRHLGRGRTSPPAGPWSLLPSLSPASS